MSRTTTCRRAGWPRTGADDRRPGDGHDGGAGLTFRTGISWTIDAPYRETVAEARHYQAEGVLCVEMEAAALFAVAQVRGLALASAFVISDSPAEEVWRPGFGDPVVQACMRGLYQAAVAVLAVGLEGSDGLAGLWRVTGRFKGRRE